MKRILFLLFVAFAVQAPLTLCKKGNLFGGDKEQKKEEEKKEDSNSPVVGTWQSTRGPLSVVF